MVPEHNDHERLKHQIQSLRSGNRTAILATLKELRSHGSVAILPELFDLLLDQDDGHVTAAISALLCDLKDEEAAPILAEAIDNKEYSEIQAILVSACWQNGLSFSKHIETFVEVVIKGGYDAAIEAFTVIEEAVGDLGPDERERLLKDLKSRSKEIGEQKRPLLSELVKVITLY